MTGCFLNSIESIERRLGERFNDIHVYQEVSS